MKRRIRPRNNGEVWNECNVLDEEIPDCFRSCWCQDAVAAYSDSVCSCDCHEDHNSRGVYGK